MELTAVMSVCCMTAYISSAALKDQSEINTAFTAYWIATCTYVHFQRYRTDRTTHHTHLQHDWEPSFLTCSAWQSTEIVPRLNTIVGMQSLSSACCRSDLDTNSSFTLSLRKQLEGRGAGGGELWEEAQLSNPGATAFIINITARLSMHRDSCNKALARLESYTFPNLLWMGSDSPRIAHPTLKNLDLGTSSSFCKVIFPGQPDGWPKADECEGRNEREGGKGRADLIKYLVYFTSIFLTPRENGLFPVQKL